jgi:hypothetical protein
MQRQIRPGSRSLVVVESLLFDTAKIPDDQRRREVRSRRRRPKGARGACRSRDETHGCDRVLVRSTAWNRE